MMKKIILLISFVVIFAAGAVTATLLHIGSPIVCGQLVQPIFHGDPPASSGVLPDSTSEFLVYLVRPDHAGSIDDESKKVDVGSSINGTLGFIDRELASSFDATSPGHRHVAFLSMHFIVCDLQSLKQGNVNVVDYLTKSERRVQCSKNHVCW